MSWSTEQFIAYLNRHEQRREGHALRIIDKSEGVEFTIHDSANKLNKLERAYLAYLQGLKPSWLGVQNVTLVIGHDTRYTPDFIVILNGKLSAREVKGFMRDDARVKLMVVARQFPWINFVLVTGKAGEWVHTDVKS